MRDLKGLPNMVTVPEIQQVVRETLEFLNCGHLKLKVTFDGRFTLRLGDATYGMMRLRFSAPLWPYISKLDRYDCIAHEVAHIVTDHRYGQGVGRQLAWHGYKWKSVMRELGIEPAVYAQM